MIRVDILHRRFIYLDNGSSIIDTRIREIGYWFNEASQNEYEDIEIFSKVRNSNDCKHKEETKDVPLKMQ